MTSIPTPEELANATGYSSEPDDDHPEAGSVDALIAYKNALEDALHQALDHIATTRRRPADALLQIHRDIFPERYEPDTPTYQWHAGTIEHVAESLEQALRPDPRARVAGRAALNPRTEAPPTVTEPKARHLAATLNQTAPADITYTVERTANPVTNTGGWYVRRNKTR